MGSHSQRVPRRYGRVIGPSNLHGSSIRYTPKSRRPRSVFSRDKNKKRPSHFLRRLLHHLSRYLDLHHLPLYQPSIFRIRLLIYPPNVSPDVLHRMGLRLEQQAPTSFSQGRARSRLVLAGVVPEPRRTLRRCQQPKTPTNSQFPVLPVVRSHSSRVAHSTRYVVRTYLYYTHETDFFSLTRQQLRGLSAIDIQHQSPHPLSLRHLGRYTQMDHSPTSYILPHTALPIAGTYPWLLSPPPPPPIPSSPPALVQALSGLVRTMCQNSIDRRVSTHFHNPRTPLSV